MGLLELLESYLTRTLFRPLTHQLISIKGLKGLLPPPQSEEGEEEEEDDEEENRRSNAYRIYSNKRPTSN